MNLTPAQQKAVDTRNCSLLVSAGAGSGKTAVLTQRITQRLCDANDDCDITDFLVVTFTNAAAKELTDRLRSKLSEAARNNPGNKKIMRNIALMPLAKVCTIDSFCFDVVKKNFQTLGISPSVRIADESEMKVLRSRIINDVVNDAFENTDQEALQRFIDVYEIFSGVKSDESFINVLLDIDQKLKSDINEQKLMQDMLEMYKDTASCHNFFESAYGKLLHDIAKNNLEKAKNKLEKAASLCVDGSQLEKKYLPSIQDEAEKVRYILGCLEQDYSSAREAVLAYTMGKVGSVSSSYENHALKKAVKAMRDESVELVRKDTALLFEVEEKTLRTCAYDCMKILEVVFGLIGEFSRRLDITKKDLCIADFNDVEHFTIQLLCVDGDVNSPSDIALAMREQYKEIYIDEYQDVNPLQDCIFKLISKTDNVGVERTRFMVGDLKQSIYRFRGARPDIFKGYRDAFDEADSASSTRRIFMQDNFRCANHVIGLTNALFKRLMGNNYEAGDSLLFSRLEEKPVQCKSKLVLCDYDKALADKLSAEEIEAHAVAQKIKEIVNNEEYLDSKGDKFTYGNIAVLARKKDTLKMYSSVFSQYGIPVYSSVGESFYQKKEILLALCILNSVDNPMRDIYLAGFMRSIPGGFSDDELCLIKENSKTLKLYQSVVKYAEDFTETQLGEKCRAFIETLNDYRSLSRAKNASEFVWEIYVRTDLLNLCSSPVFNDDGIEVCANRRKNLLKLYEMARSFTKTSFKGIGAFIEYINGAMDSTDEKADTVIGSDCVMLMTVHASKGLEFPVCFVSSMSKDFRGRSKKTVFSNTNGIGLTLRDVGSLTCQRSATGRVTIDTPYRNMIKLSEAAHDVEEEMRILYVALTRARDYLFMTGCESNLSKKLSQSMANYLSDDYANASSFTEAILNCVVGDKCANEMCEMYDVGNVGVVDGEFSNYLECQVVCCEDIVKKMSAQQSRELENLQNACDGALCDKELYAKLKELGNFTYSNKILTQIPSKLTVSQLKTGLLDDDGENLVSAKRDLKRVPDFTVDNTVPKASEKGTAMHLFMQFCDFDDCVKCGCAAHGKKLLEGGFIDSRTYEMLDFVCLDKFFKTPLYMRIAESPAIYRETRFNLKTDANEFSENLPKNTYSVLVQGVIDLYFANPDGSYTVVDFKTDRVFGDDARETLILRHKRQLLYYKQAVESITSAPVSKALLFSFSLMDEIEVE